MIANDGAVHHAWGAAFKITDPQNAKPAVVEMKMSRWSHFLVAIGLKPVPSYCIPLSSYLGGVQDQMTQNIIKNAYARLNDGLYTFGGQAPSS